jgi:GAF domain-containing protein
MPRDRRAPDIRSDLNQRGAVLQRIRDIVEETIPPDIPPLEIDDRLERVCSLLHDEFPQYDWVGFYFLDPERPQELVLGPYAGEPLEFTTVPLGRGACGRAARDGDVYVNPDLESVPDTEAAHPDLRSEIAAPLVHEERVVGVLNVDSRLPSAFEREDRDFLRRIGRLAGPLVARRFRSR